MKLNYYKILTLTLLLNLMFAGSGHAFFSGFGSNSAEDPAQATINNNIQTLNFKDLVKQASPAVVNISTERTTTTQAFPFDPNFFRGNPFFDNPQNPFFGNPFGEQEIKRKQRSLGSGFFISKDGYIVTNNHVVAGADSIKVTFAFDLESNQEHTFDAVIIGADPATDLALLKIESADVPFIQFGDSDKLDVGEWLIAIGNPFGLDHTVTAGILSAKFRNIDSLSLVRFLQTDASINPGNSGGPLLNMQGEVIGINTAISAQGQGIGFAIPSSLASKIITDLKANRKVSRGWLGVTIQNVDKATAKALGLEKPTGALIGGIIPDQPAAKAGLQSCDVILKVDNQDVFNSDELVRIIASKKPEETVNLNIFRESKILDVKVTLNERQAEALAQKSPTPSEKNKSSASLGIELYPLSKADLEKYKFDFKGGLVVNKLEAEKLAAKAGLRRGDTILSVGRKPTLNVDDFNNEVKKMFEKNGAILLEVYRNGQTFLIAIDMTEDK